jgi:hypothetical protein
MTQDERYIRERGKMHPLFRELYLTGDLDDPYEAEEEGRAERTRARARRMALQKLVQRRA